MRVFEQYDTGRLILPNGKKEFDQVPWSKHTIFEGVELKHIVTSKETEGRFSYHLIRIAPHCSIGKHIHENQLETHEVMEGSGECINSGVIIPYQVGTISIFPAEVEHEVKAGVQGLSFFAKFIPALC